MANQSILILNRNPEERELLDKLCKSLGSVYLSTDLEKAISLLESTHFNVLIVDNSMANYSFLKASLKKKTSVIITGEEEKKIEEILREWPINLYVDYQKIPKLIEDKSTFLRALATSAEHSRLTNEAEKLNHTIERNEIEIKEACTEIKNIKNFISESIVKELEKRIAIEAKYISFQREKQKIEEILRKIYIANDVTILLDIVYDIKEIVRAQSITMYILEENETLGKYLKPLVWDNAFLTHQQFTDYIVMIDAQDFAASTARYGQEINISNLSFDRRLSKRYTQHLKAPLNNILCVPIMHDKQTIGVLEVYNKMPRKKTDEEGFTREDQQILRRLSEHISIAITKLNLIQYDALTGLLRPDPFFDKILQKLKSYTKRRQEEALYAMVMGDVDWFKNYNDRNGHESGNRLLRELARVLRSSIREEDLLCRYGGEEFLFFLTGISDPEEALRLTERIRKNVEEYYFDHQEFQPRTNLTMSLGVAYFSRDRFDSMDTVSKKDLKRIANEADIALAEAKGKKSIALNGKIKDKSAPDKNKVCVYYKKEQEESEAVEYVKPYQEKVLQERRKFKRFYTSTALVYSNMNGSKVTKTINLSLGGTRISTKTKLPLAQTLDLTLILGNNACQLRGDVIYSEQVESELSLFHSGLKFKDLSYDDKKLLEDYFSSLNQ